MEPIKLYWWKPKRSRKINLGDQISRDLVREASGREVA